MLDNIFRRKNEGNFLVRHWRWTLLGILLVAAALRLINIGAEPYWGDELTSLDIATSFNGVGEMLRYLAEVEVHPPLYHLLLRGWVGVFGATEAATRSLSLLFSLATIVVAYVLGRRVGGSKAIGLISALVIALLPMQIELGQDARPYSIYCFFAGLAMLAVWEYLQHRQLRWLAVYVFAAVCGLYLHYSFILTFLALVLWWLLAEIFRPPQNRSRQLLIWLIVQAVVFLAFYPWLRPFLYLIFLGQYTLFDLVRNNTSLREPGFYDAALDRIVWLTKHKAVPQVQLLAALIFKIGFLAAAALALQPVLQKLTQRKPDANRWRWLFLLFMILVPLVLFACSPASLSYTALTHKHIIPVTLPLAILLAMVVVRQSRRWGAILLVLFFVTLLPYVTDVIANDAEWDMQHRVAEVGQYINQYYQPGDLVVTTYASSRSCLAHYIDPDIPIESLVPINYFGLDIWRGERVSGLIENEIQARVPTTTLEEIHWKLDQLQRRHQPQRIWLFGVVREDAKIHSWFNPDEWRHGIQSINNVILLDLYVKQE